MYVLYVFSLTWHLEYTWDEIHETLSKNKYKGEVKVFAQDEYSIVSMKRFGIKD